MLHGGPSHAVSFSGQSRKARDCLPPFVGRNVPPEKRVLLVARMERDLVFWLLTPQRLHNTLSRRRSDFSNWLRRLATWKLV